jgi:hypothetical protein
MEKLSRGCGAFRLKRYPEVNSHRSADVESVRSEIYGGKNSTTTKLERYKWKLKDEPGKLRMLPKEKIVVDESYQRVVNEPKAVGIARAWSYVACGALIVAYRDGVFYAVDGQHRLAAALRRADITHLPCIVFETDDSKQEAKGFLDANTFRKALTSLDKFKAQIATGDHAAVAIHKMLEASGYVASKTEKARGVRCVAVLMRNYIINKEDFEAAWPAIVASASGGAIMERTVDGLVWIEKHAFEGTLAEAKWIKRVQAVGQPALLEAAAKASAYYARGGAAVWGQGMLRAINHRLKEKFQVEKPE